MQAAYLRTASSFAVLIAAGAILFTISFIVIHGTLSDRQGSYKDYFSYSLVFGEKGVNDASIIEGFSRPHRLGAVIKAQRAKVQLDGAEKYTGELIVYVRFWSILTNSKRAIYMRVNGSDEVRSEISGHNPYEVKMNIERRILEEDPRLTLSIYTKERADNGTKLPLDIFLTSVSVYQVR